MTTTKMLPNASAIISTTTFSPFYANNTDNLTIHNDSLSSPVADGSASQFSCSDVVQYAYPIQVTICIIGNVLNLLVLTRERITMRRGWTATQVFITTVSITDMLFLGFQFVPYMDGYHLHMDYENKTRNVFEHFVWYTGGIWSWGQATFGLISDLTLVAFSIERCLATLRPMSRRFACGRASIARNIVIVIVVFTGLHAAINAGIYYRAIVLLDNYNKTRIEATKSDYMEPWLGSWLREYQLVHLILLPMAVFITLATTTTLMLIALARRRRLYNMDSSRNIPHTTSSSQSKSSCFTLWQRRRRRPAPEHTALRQHLSPVARIRDELSSRQYTLMLIASVCMYLITCSLNFILNVSDFLAHYLNVKNALANGDNVVTVLRACDPFVLNWNYVLNFVLYSAVSSKFRDNMRDLARFGLRRITITPPPPPTSPLSQRSSVFTLASVKDNESTHRAEEDQTNNGFDHGELRNYRFFRETLTSTNSSTATEAIELYDDNHSSQDDAVSQADHESSATAEYRSHEG